MRKVMIICLLIICFTLCSCEEPVRIEIPVGEKITEDFKVNSYFNDNAIIEASSSINIVGVSEEGVVMIASVYDNKGKLVSQNYGIAGLDNIFSITINTPTASTKEYKLEIKDSFDTYIHTYNNIKFGEVWLINTNELTEVDEVSDNNIKNKNIGYYYVNKEVSSWETNENVSSYIKKLAEKIYQQHESLISNDVPIGIIVLDSEKSNLYEWVSKNNIDRVKYLKDYLVHNDLYDSEMTSNLYEKMLKPLEGIKFTGYIWHFSDNDSSFSLGKNYEKAYAIMLNLLTNYFCDAFGENVKKVFIQSESSTIESIEILRTHQMNNSYYFSNTYLIPTYDLNVLYDEELNENNIVEIDENKLIDRIIKVVYDGVRPSGYSKLVSLYNEKEELTKVSIYISNTDYLMCDISDADYIAENGLKFLKIYDVNNNLIDLDYVINNNVIEIDLEIKDIISEDVKDVPLEKQYYQISRIEYDVKKENGNCWIYNDENIPLLPFTIEVGK